MPQSERALSGPFPVRAVIDACVFPKTKRWLIPITRLAADRFVLPVWSPLIIAESKRVLTWLLMCCGASVLWYANDREARSLGLNEAHDQQ